MQFLAILDADAASPDRPRSESWSKSKR